MASYDPNKQPKVNMYSSDPRDQQRMNPGFFSKVLQNLSSWNWGMKYDDMALRNTAAVGINELPNPNQGAINNSDNPLDNDYYYFAQRAMANFMSKKAVAYFDRSYPEKRQILSEYSVKQEIREFVQILCNEVIVYDTKNRFCTVNDLDGAYSENIKSRLSDVFNILYARFGFQDGRTAWNYFRKFIVEGYLAFEIVYDDKQKNIIGLHQVDPFTLIPTVDPYSGKPIWIQYPDDPYNRRILLDSQIIYLSYSNLNSPVEISYVEGLIRPYNLYKIIEETRVMYNITNAAPYKKFIIPTDGLSRSQAQQTIAQLMAAYEDKMYFDSNSGQVFVNGEANIPYSKEVWLPQNSQSTPTFELVSTDGPNLNEVDVIKHFEDSLKRASGIPFTRLDKDSGGGNMFTAMNEVTRDELNFSRFVDSLRAAFKEIMIKPLWIQMHLEFPELLDDEQFRSNLSIKYNKDNVFEEWKTLSNLDSRANVISNLYNNLKVGEESYFDIEYLIKQYLGMTDEDLRKNRATKQKSAIDKENSSSAEAPAGDEGIF